MDDQHRGLNFSEKFYSERFECKLTESTVNDSKKTLVTLMKNAFDENALI